MSLATGRLIHSAVGAAAGGFLVCIGCAAAVDPSAPVKEPAPGYPAATSRLTLSLGGDYQKLCHATLVDPDWALTAAHCFSEIEPTAYGALVDFGRGLSVSDVILHPGALESGTTRLDAVWRSTDFVAAHDLALVPVVPAMQDVDPVPHWLPIEGCALAEDLGIPGRFGKLGPNDEAQTAEATLLGTVPAASLLGPEHPGALLSAQGVSVGPGDSGSGVSAAFGDLEALAPGCARSAGNDDDVLMGVIQDAHPEVSTRPFGLTPLYPYDHSRWLSALIETPPPAQPPRPRLNP